MSRPHGRYLWSISFGAASTKDRMPSPHPRATLHRQYPQCTLFFFPGPNRQTKAHPMHRMRIKHSAGERRAWHRERVTRGYSSGHGGGSFFGGHCGVFAGPSFAVGVVLQEGGTARDSRDVPDTTYGPNRQERGELPETIIQEEEGGDAGAPPPSLPSPSPGGCAREGSRSFHKNVPR